MNTPTFYDGRGKLQPEVIEAVSNKNETKESNLEIPKITDIFNKPSYYDGSGKLSFK